MADGWVRSATAAIYPHGEWLMGTSFFGSGGGTGLRGPVEVIGDEPMIVGGVLPDGAASVRVQDLFDAWHDGVVGDGAWLCALPHAARGGRPPVTFLDRSGEPVTIDPPEPERFEIVHTFSVADPGSAGPTRDSRPTSQPSLRQLPRRRVDRVADRRSCAPASSTRGSPRRTSRGSSGVDRGSAAGAGRGRGPRSRVPAGGRRRPVGRDSRRAGAGSTWSP